MTQEAEVFNSDLVKLVKKIVMISDDVDDLDDVDVIIKYKRQKQSITKF